MAPFRPKCGVCPEIPYIRDSQNRPAPCRADSRLHRIQTRFRVTENPQQDTRSDHRPNTNGNRYGPLVLFRIVIPRKGAVALRARDETATDANSFGEDVDAIEPVLVEGENLSVRGKRICPFSEELSAGSVRGVSRDKTIAVKARQPMRIANAAESDYQSRCHSASKQPFKSPTGYIIICRSLRSRGWH